MISKSLETSLLKLNIIQFRIIWKNVGMSDLDIDLALNRYCIRSWDYSAHALRYAIVFSEKNFSYYIVLLLLNMPYLYTSSCKPNKQWTHIALNCYNESEKCYKNKPKAARNKGFVTYVDLKAITLKLWKWNYYSIIWKSLDLKIWIHVCLFFFRRIL